MSDDIITIPGRRYRTINSCLAAFFDCRVKKLDTMEGVFQTRSADGVDKEYDVQ